MGRNEKPNDRPARGIYSASTSGVSTAQDFLKLFKMHTFKRTQVRAPTRTFMPHLVPASLSSCLPLPNNRQTLSPILKTLLIVFGCLLPLLSTAAEIIQSDICIYGGTAAGVAAAGEVARSGKTAGFCGIGGPPG